MFASSSSVWTTAFLFLLKTNAVEAFLAPQPGQKSENSNIKSKSLFFTAERSLFKQRVLNASNPLESFLGLTQSKTRVAQELLTELIDTDKCFTTFSGAEKFADCCASDIVYEDCFEPQPIVGKINVREHMAKKVEMRKNKNGEFGLRLDKISDGSKACGFAWTYTTTTEEGLRGTTFVELNDNGEISYVREIPEPIFKPGDLTQQLLEAVTKGAPPKPKVEFEQRTPQTASAVAEYLFREVQGSSIDEAMRLFDDSILYRDFNFKDILNGKSEVRQFIEDFSFPGITFRMQKIDDGIDSTAFTWEVVLEVGVDEDGNPEAAPDTIKGISFYQLDANSKLINYVRDVPESAIKPPILGKLARDLRPGLGVFQGVKLGSREGGL